MPIEQTIEDAQQEFVEQYEQAVDSFVSHTKEIEEEDGITTEQVVLALGGLVILDYWMQDLQMEKAVNQYMLRIDSVLDDLRFFGKMTEAELASIRLMNENLIRSYTASLGEGVRIATMRGISSKISFEEVKSLILRDYYLRGSSVSTFVQTHLANYANMITQQMAETMPEDTLFVFKNPIDEKTRHVCIKMVSFGPMTRSEIEKQFPGAFFDRGGPNCRGHWEIAQDADKSLIKTAKKQFKGLQNRYNKKGRTLNIKTQKQYYQDRQNG